jgi:hypothetical protein
MIDFGDMDEAGEWWEKTKTEAKLLEKSTSEPDFQ